MTAAPPPRAFAPAAPGPGSVFSSVVGLLTILGPLTLLGLVLCVDRNIQTYAGDYASRFVFRAALKQDVSAPEAEQLALKWRKSPLWRSVRVMAPEEDFAEIPELKGWLATPQNRTIAASMPHSIVLVPADILRADPQTSYLESVLTVSPQVDQVFFDRTGLAWVRRTLRAWNAVGTALAAFLAVLAIATSVAAGWLAERLARVEGARTRAGASALRNRPGLIVLLASSGLLAVFLLSLLFALVRFLSDIGILFLSISQCLSLAAFGVCLGSLAVGFRYWIGRRLGRILLVLVGVVCFSCGAAGAAAEDGADSLRETSATTTPSAETGETPSSAIETGETPVLPYRPAIPSQKARPVSELDAASDLSSLSEDERRSLIDEKRRTYDYLDAWHLNALKGQDLDRQNRNVIGSRLDTAQRDRERLEESIAKRFDRAERLTEGIRLAQLEPSPFFVNGFGQARRDLATYLLKRNAHQSFFMLDVERERLKETRDEIARLEEELRCLNQVSGRGGSETPDDIEREKRRLAEEIVMLMDQNHLLNTAPESLADANATVGESAVAGENGTIAAKALLPAHGANTTRGRNRQDGGYYFLADRGTLIHAAVGGRVLFASYFTGLGNTVILDHGGGYSSVYAFLDDVVVRPDQQVAAGAYIGSAGIIKRLDKGGIRFEVRKDGKRTRPSGLAPLAGADLRQLVFGPFKQNAAP